MKRSSIGFVQISLYRVCLSYSERSYGHSKNSTAQRSIYQRVQSCVVLHPQISYNFVYCIPVALPLGLAKELRGSQYSRYHAIAPPPQYTLCCCIPLQHKLPHPVTRLISPSAPSVSLLSQPCSTRLPLKAVSPSERVQFPGGLSEAMESTAQLHSTAVLSPMQRRCACRTRTSQPPRTTKSSCLGSLTDSGTSKCIHSPYMTHPASVLRGWPCAGTGSG